MKGRLFVDLLLAIVLAMLMAFQTMAEAVHEWLGCAMLVLFLLHIFLNVKWLRMLFRGRYDSGRLYRAAVNVALLLAMLAMGYSGIILSREAFSFLGAKSGIALARSLHLAGAYWLLVLAGLHIGLHLKMIGAFLFGKTNDRLAGGFWRLAGFFFAVYGAVCCYEADIFSYMIFNVQFAFFDFDKSFAAVLFDNTAMLWLWASLGGYVTERISRHTKRRYLFSKGLKNL